ncbi:MAG: PIN domain-containing protein [Acidobacteriota bacterium]
MSAVSSPRTFFDTNILAYADDGAEPVKQRKALDLIKDQRRRRTGVVSIQVLQEYFNAAIRKLGMDAAIVRRKIEFLARFDVVETNVSDVLAAIDLHRLHQLSFWDALVIQSARKAGCRVLLSEDLQHGQTIDGVRIVNPFLS